MGLPWSDGKGFLPDSRRELGFIGVLLVLLALGFAFFTSLDAQVMYAVSSPGDYLSVSSDKDKAVYLTDDQIGNINFAAKNRIGVTSMGDEIGMCAGFRSSGDVTDLRLAEGFEETSRTSVTFSCVRPRSFIIHSQPGYSSGLSPEDKSFDGEFRPEVSCIVFGELAASPVNGKVGGINCWDVGSSGSFESIPVQIKG